MTSLDQPPTCPYIHGGGELLRQTPEPTAVPSANDAPVRGTEIVTDPVMAPDGVHNEPAASPVMPDNVVMASAAPLLVLHVTGC